MAHRTRGLPPLLVAAILLPTLASVAQASAPAPAAAPASAPAASSALPDVSALVAQLGLQESATPVRDRPGWRPPRRIVVWNMDPAMLPALASVAPGVELVPVDTPLAAAAAAPGADAVLGFCTAEILAAGRDIRWIQSYSAGVERCVGIPALAERDVLLTNMQRVAGPVMAEHVMAMVLALARSLDFFAQERAAHRWTQDPPPPYRMLALEGKTMLVVGLGGIGTEVARRASAFGMRVIAIRASGREGPPFVSYVGAPGELAKLAATADFVVNTAPLTPATRGMYDAAFFAAVKQGAYFVNVGRGQSVVQADLVAALRSGRLAGAGLDVTDPEPLPADSALWTLPNVILTPHVSADSDLGQQARFAILRENLRRYVAGERMLSVVDLAKGY